MGGGIVWESVHRRQEPGFGFWLSTSCVSSLNYLPSLSVSFLSYRIIVSLKGNEFIPSNWEGAWCKVGSHQPQSLISSRRCISLVLDLNLIVFIHFLLGKIRISFIFNLSIVPVPFFSLYYYSTNCISSVRKLCIASTLFTSLFPMLSTGLTISWFQAF